MSADNRNPPETPEAAAWELFQEIRRAEEAGQDRSNTTPRARLLSLYAECLAVTSGHARDWQDGLLDRMLH
jgi:hypothetical protein